MQTEKTLPIYAGDNYLTDIPASKVYQLRAYAELLAAQSEQEEEKLQ
jgi:hypothetical protein